MPTHALSSLTNLREEDLLTPGMSAAIPGHAKLRLVDLNIRPLLLVDTNYVSVVD